MTSNLLCWVGPDGEIWGSPVALALRQLRMTEVPTKKLPYREAQKQYQIDMALSGILKRNELDVDELMVGARIELCWHRYWSGYHQSKGARTWHMLEFLRLIEVMERVA
jgi:hypothetical protein